VNINKFICTGRLTKDPEQRVLPNGTSVCELRLAVNGMGRKSEVGFINLSVYGKSADACAQYLSKGSKVGVDGRLEYGEWDTEDGKRHDYSVVANTVEFLTPRSSEEEPEAAAEAQEPVAA